VNKDPLENLIERLFREVIAGEVEDMIPNHHEAGDKLCESCYAMQKVAQRIRKEQ